MSNAGGEFWKVLADERQAENYGCTTNAVMAKVFLELVNAVSLHPSWPTDPVHAAAIVAEESGELVQASLQSVYEPHKSGLDNARQEAIQTAAMAVRFVIHLSDYELTAPYQSSKELE